MALSVSHTFVSPVVDDGVTSEVGPNEWNAVHTLAGTVDSTQITAGGVAEANLATDAVTSTKIKDGAVVAAKIATDTITSTQIAADAITSSELKDASVVYAKIQDVSVGSVLLGRDTSGAGDVMEIILGTNLSMSGSTLNATGGGTLGDGDYGDITVSGTGTILTIDAGVVNSTKLLDGGVIEAKIATDAVTSTKIKDGAVITAKIAAQAVTSSEIKLLGVTAAQIANDTITSTQIATDGVASNEIKDASVIEAKLATDAVTSTKIKDGAVITAKIANSAVTSTQLATDAVTSIKILDGAVISTKLGTDAVTSAKILDGAVISTKIGTDAVTSAKILDGAVISTKIGTGAVVTVKIAAQAVTSAEVKLLGITAAQIANDTITSTQIAADAVTSSELATDAVTSAKILADAVISTKIRNDAVITAKILDANVTSTKIVDGGVIEAKIATDAVTSTKIKDAAVITAKIAGQAVTSSEIKLLGVTAAQIADNTITSTQIANDAVASNEILAGAVVNAKLATDAVTSTKILDAGVSLAKLVDASTGSLLMGRRAGSAGDFEEITLGTGLSMTGSVLSSTGGSGISNVVEDTSPQLGGDLDVNGNSIDLGNVYPHFNAGSSNRVVFNASDPPTNEAGTVFHFASGNSSRDVLFSFSKTGVHTSFFGDDGTNLVVVSEGTGDFIWRSGGDYSAADILSSGTERFRVNDDGTFLANSFKATFSDAALDVLFGWDDSDSTYRSMLITDITTEAAPAAGDFVLIYRAEGDLRKVNWSGLPGAGGGISNVVEDTSPQLGGTLESNNNNIELEDFAADNDACNLIFQKSRNAVIGSHTVVQADDYIGIIDFRASDGDEFARAAAIYAQVDSTPGDNDMPGRLVFETTPNASSTSIERMRISNNGYVGVSGTVSVRDSVDISGAIDIAGVRQKLSVVGSTLVLGMASRNTSTAGFTDQSLINDGTIDTSRAVFGIGGSTATAPYTNKGYFYSGATLSGLLISARAGDINFYTGGSETNERMSIDSTGLIWVGDSTHNLALSRAANGRLLVEGTTAVTSAVASTTVFRHTTSGTVTSIGIGQAMVFEQDTGTSNYEIGCVINTIFEDTTSTSEDSAVRFDTMVAGAVTTAQWINRVKRTTATQSATSTTGVECTELQFPAVQPGTYGFRYYLNSQTSSTAKGKGYGLHFTGTGTIAGHRTYVGTGSTAATAVPGNTTNSVTGWIYHGHAFNAFSSAAPNTMTAGYVATATDILEILQGVLVVTAAGNLSLYHSNELGTTSTSVSANTIAVLERYA